MFVYVVTALDDGKIAIQEVYGHPECAEAAVRRHSRKFGTSNIALGVRQVLGDPVDPVREIGAGPWVTPRSFTPPPSGWVEVHKGGDAGLVAWIRRLFHTN